MSNITFDEIMEFYPRHNRSVYEELKKEYQRGCLIPFVGAGLSVFCGYKSWPDVLKELAEFVFSKEKRIQIEQMIIKGELLQAAQMIYDNYPLMLNELSKIVGYEKIEKCDAGVLHTSAAYVLPYLFGENLVMTTNFDRVLEEVYEKHHAKFGKVVTPYESDLLVQIRQKDSHCLFKLHGDIGPETHDIEKLVFTQAQYDKAYAVNGALVQELSQWFQNKRLLFLGCSLAMDKTMEVLQMATKKNISLSHYAILACNSDDMECRIGEMGKLGISAIFYPDGKHEAVRVLLERLLEETNSKYYEELCRCTKELAKVSGTEYRFMYYSEYFEFTGREKELDFLDEFCQGPEQISWWAVTGPGGMGKSRLVYEFTKKQRLDGWRVLWLTPNDYHNLSQVALPVDSCIVVADDVQEHLQAVGEWLVSVSNRHRSEKLRIILLERDGKDLNSAKWMEMLQADFPYDSTIYSKCYCSEFLQLDPLSEENLKTIMINFAAASGKPLTGCDHAQRLLHTLQKIDRGLQRPIYALAVADAWCSGKDPAKWDKTQVLETLVDRELLFYYKRLRSISGKSPTKKMCAEFENIVARSCVMPFLPLDHISEEEYPKLSKKAEELDLDFSELLQLTGVVHKVSVWERESGEGKSENKEKQMKRFEAVELNCPDLVKEYMVLRQAFDRGQYNLLFPENWDNNPMQLVFLQRVLRDYPEKLDGNKQFWNLFFTGSPKDNFNAWLYSNFLFGITAQIPHMAKRAVEYLEKLQTLFNTNENIAIAYASGLVNLTAEQELVESMLSVQKLEKLYSEPQFSDNEEIANAYADGLVNLMLEQELNDLALSVDKLEKLRELPRFSENEKIAVVYALSLVKLAVEQDLDDLTQNIQKVENLYIQPCFHDNEDIVMAYALGLTSMAAEQELDGCVISVQHIENLLVRFPTNEEIVSLYSSCLVVLSFRQKSEIDVRDTLKRAKTLLSQHPENTKVQLSFAKTKFNLTLQQESVDLQETVAELREYLLEHPDIIVEFQDELTQYLDMHPEHTERYKLLRV